MHIEKYKYKFLMIDFFKYKISTCDCTQFEQVCEHMKKIIIFVSHTGFFQNIDDWYMVRP